jgi:hypothetical protein
MVVIHVKKTDLDQFLFFTTCAESNDSLIRSLVCVVERARGGGGASLCSATYGVCVWGLSAKARPLPSVLETALGGYQVAISNKRFQVQRLVAAVRELAKHGPMRPEATRGLDDVGGPPFPPPPAGAPRGHSQGLRLCPVLSCPTGRTRVVVAFKL